MDFWKSKFLLKLRIILLIIIVGSFGSQAYARHFKLELAYPPQIPPYEYYMTIGGDFKFNGKPMDIKDEIGIFVKLDNGSWRLCGVGVPISGGKYSANVFSYKCIDKNQSDGKDIAPIDNSPLKIKLWDNSKGTERDLEKSEISIISPDIKHNKQFIYKKNTTGNEWILNITITTPISITDVDPATGSTDTITTITITGKNLEENMSVILDNYTLDSVTFIDENHIKAVVPKELSVRKYNIKVIRTSDGKYDVLNNAFEIK